jgi:hypothetical protein
VTRGRQPKRRGAPRDGRAAGAAILVLLGAVVLGAACGGDRASRGGAADGSAANAGEASGGEPAAGAAAQEPGSAAAGIAGAGSAPGGDAASGAAAEQAPAPGEPNRREVVLFFQRADEDALGPERRKIFLTPSITDQAKQIVSELIGGPREEGFLPTVPSKTTILGLYLDRKGTAYLDLSDEFVSLHPGGSDEEMATIFSIVDSLAYNLPEIKRVRFLIAGEERDTLKSHLDLRRAYIKDMSIVRLEEGG